MGHYYSEMVSDKDLEEKAAEAKRRRDSRTAKIQAAIDERGVASVLAEMLDDDVLFRIRYR